MNQQLLDAVLRSPKDDAARLAAADGFESSGDRDRAELIRVQVRRAALERAEQETAELRELTGTHLRLTRSLVPRLEPGLRRHGLELRYDRGFAETAAGDAAAWARAGLRSEAPILALDLSGAELALDALLGALPGIISLDLSRSRLSEAQILQLAASPAVAGLTWLDLRYSCRLSVQGLQALAASPHLRGLRWLGVAGTFDELLDQPIEDDERLVDWRPTVLGEALEAAHGSLSWLHYRPRSLRFYPPPRCQFLEGP